VGQQVLCVSHDGCSVSDSNGGASRFDCKAAGLDNLFGSVDLARAPGLAVDKFNPGGSVEARWEAAAGQEVQPPVVAGAALTFENADLHGKDVEGLGANGGAGLATGRGGEGGSEVGRGLRGGEGHLQLGDDGSRRMPLNGEARRPWRPTPLVGTGRGAEEEEEGEVEASECPGEADQYGWRPATRPCGAGKVGNAVEEMPTASGVPGIEGGWTEGYNTANGESCVRVCGGGCRDPVARLCCPVMSGAAS
jgi:hypothetical protein